MPPSIFHHISTLVLQFFGYFSSLYLLGPWYLVPLTKEQKVTSSFTDTFSTLLIFFSCSAKNIPFFENQFWKRQPGSTEESWNPLEWAASALGQAWLPLQGVSSLPSKPPSAAGSWLVANTNEADLALSSATPLKIYLFLARFRICKTNLQNYHFLWLDWLAFFRCEPKTIGTTMSKFP